MQRQTGQSSCRRDRLTGWFLAGSGDDVEAGANLSFVVLRRRASWLGLAAFRLFAVGASARRFDAVVARGLEGAVVGVAHVGHWLADRRLGHRDPLSFA